MILKLEDIVNRSATPEKVRVRSLKVSEELSTINTEEEMGFENIRKRLEEIEIKINDSRSGSKAKEKFEADSENKTNTTKLEHAFWGG